MKGNALTKDVLLPKQKPRPKPRLMRGGTPSKAIVISGSRKAPVQGAMPADSNMMKPEREPEDGPDLPAKREEGGIDPTVLALVEPRTEARALQAKVIDLPAFIFVRANVRRGTNVTFGILQYATDLRRVLARWATNAHFFIRVLSLLPRSPLQKQRRNPKPIAKAEELPYR